jgi:hypothetical protein
VLAKEDYGVAMQLAREIEEQERQLEVQWEADRRLARQIASEERTDHKKLEKAEAQVPLPRPPLLLSPWPKPWPWPYF